MVLGGEARRGPAGVDGAGLTAVAMCVEAAVAAGAEEALHSCSLADLAVLRAVPQATADPDTGVD
ncbi:hypothetical protein AB0D59_20815 [Streptomyces sp. NPDC048417]|uniref:hypothetical protein n=1 Tax=Streptomyces sp. NPDC048417 TaxID=3155387 RepID=UPI003429A1AA